MGGYGQQYVVPVEITIRIYIALLKLIPSGEMQDNLKLFFRDSELWSSAGGCHSGGVAYISGEGSGVTVSMGGITRT